MNSRNIFIVADVYSSIENIEPKGKVFGKYFTTEASVNNYLKSFPEGKNAIVYRVTCNSNEFNRVTEALSNGGNANLEQLQHCEYKPYSKSQPNLPFVRFDPKAPVASHAKSS